MKGSSFGYLVGQGIKNTWLNRLMSLASIGILIACFIIIGGAAIITLNVRDFLVSVQSQNEIVVYLQDGMSDNDVEAVKQELSVIDGVYDIVFVSKDMALEEQREFMGEQGDLLVGLEDDNPLPASFRVKLSNLNEIDTVQSIMESLEFVDTISAPVDLAKTLTGIQTTVVALGGVIIIILLVTSLIVISNTIRLTVFARRKEINIMKYVGATNSFIRFPFIIEGMVIGLIASFISFGVLFVMYENIVTLIRDSGVAWIQAMAADMVPFSSVWYFFLGGFVVAGVLIGTVGSSSSINKYLEV